MRFKEFFTEENETFNFNEGDVLYFAEIYGEEGNEEVDIRITEWQNDYDKYEAKKEKFTLGRSSESDGWFRYYCDDFVVLIDKLLEKFPHLANKIRGELNYIKAVNPQLSDFRGIDKLKEQVRNYEEIVKRRSIIDHGFKNTDDLNAL